MLCRTAGQNPGAFPSGFASFWALVGRHLQLPYDSCYVEPWAVATGNVQAPAHVDALSHL